MFKISHNIITNPYVKLGHIKNKNTEYLQTTLFAMFMIKFNYEKRCRQQ